MSTPVSREDFAEIVTEVLTQVGIDGNLFFDREFFCLLVKDERGLTLQKINLHTFYRDFCNAESDEHRERILAKIPQMNKVLPTIPRTYEEARDRIYPHVQDLWTIEEIKLQIKLGRFGDPEVTSQMRFPCAVFAESFAGVLAYDLPGSRAIINSSHTDNWTVDFQDAFGNAYENLAERTDGRFETLCQRGSAEGVHYSIWNDGYDASRVLMSEFLCSLPVNGSHIVLLPNANMLLVTGSDDIFGLTIALEELQKAQGGSKPLPPLPISIQEGRVRKHVFPKTHPLANAYRHLEVGYFAGIYNAQKALLEGMFESLSDEIFVASYMGFQDQQGRVNSSCAWTDDVVTLLPKVDHIDFMRVQGDKGDCVASASWDSVIAEVGDLLRPMDYYPPRFKVEAFPREDQLKKLGMQDRFDS